MAKDTLDKKAALMRTSKATAVRTREQAQKTTTAGRRSAGRITSVPLSQIVLDRYQPRPILPVQDGIRDNFFAGKADWRKAANQWLELAKTDAGIANQVNALLGMGKSIEELNQIEPATGAWIERKPGEYKLLLSTGERRFWSLALLAVSKNIGEPQLEVQEIQEDELTLTRQIVENESAKPLSAIGKARAIAGLILESLEQLPPGLDKSSVNPPTDYEYYQSALDIEKLTGSKYTPRGMWEEIGQIIGMERRYMVYHLDLLRFPQELQYEADIHEIPEAVLREVLVFPPAQWGKIIEMAIKGNLSAPEVKRIRTDKGKKKSVNDSPAAKAVSRLRAFMKVTKEIKSAAAIEQVATDFAAGLDKKEILSGADTLESLAKKLRLRANP